MVVCEDVLLLLGLVELGVGGWEVIVGVIDVFGFCFFEEIMIVERMMIIIIWSVWVWKLKINDYIEIMVYVEFIWIFLCGFLCDLIFGGLFKLCGYRFLYLCMLFVLYNWCFEIIGK